ncbi:MAG: ATP-binding protein [Candidatus Margulisiibacteriota bacterium]
MKYKQRELENRILSLFEVFPIVAVTGPRQSGKSTMLQHFMDKTWAYYSLDNRELLSRINNDPGLFVNSFERNIIIDEAQKSPALFHSIKEIIDKDFSYKIILSGSANFILLKSITESLAGRVGLLELLPFSLSEYYGLKKQGIIKLIIDAEDVNYFKKKAGSLVSGQVDENMLLEFILYGGYPRINNLKDKKNAWEWFSGYITTYIERDLRDLAQVGDLDTFQRVYKMFSFQTGNILSYSNISQDIGINAATVKRYFSILSTSYQCSLLPAYYQNQKKQITRAPKMFNIDTGLSNYFMKNNSVDRMLNSGSWGAILETWIYTEIHKEINNMSAKPDIYYWRTNNGAKVDFIIEFGEKLIPIEVKSAVQISPYDLRGLKSFITANRTKKIPFGIVLYRGREIIMLEENIIALPITMFY